MWGASESLGTLVGPQTRISVTGADGNASFDAFSPDVAYNPVTDQHLAVWSASAGAGGEHEIFAQRLSSSLAELGVNDERVSLMGNDGQASSQGVDAAVAYDPVIREYLVAWFGETPVPPLVDDQFEIYARRVAGGAPLAGAGAVCKTLPPVAPATPGDPSQITRIEDGLIGTDVGDGTLTGLDLAPGAFVP